MEGKSLLTLKRVEHSLNRFNEVAVPHHLQLLRQHQANVAKWSREGDWSRVTREQARLQRVAGQLRAVLAELAALRAALRPADAPRFDALTRRARDDTLAALADCLESSPVEINRDNNEGRSSSSEHVSRSAISSESVGVLVEGGEPDAPDPTAPLVQLRIDADEYETQLAGREAALRGWAGLRAELAAVRALWDQLLQAAASQREQVESTVSSTELAAANVAEARTQLSLAEKLRGASWAAGACAGALAGGPVGLALGAKLGAAAALAGSALGALAARALARGPSAPPKRD